MSKATRTPSRSSKRTTVPAVAPTAPAAPTRPPAHPWVIEGIDYGPAIAAVHDLAAWAFDLAARDVADWPEGQRRVRTARRFVLHRLRGKHPRHAPFEDILFTAGLLARIFEAEVGLDMAEMVAILDQLGLPTEVVPLMPRRQARVSVPLHPPIAPVTPITQLRPRPVAVGAAPRPLEYCDECGQLHPCIRNAA